MTIIHVSVPAPNGMLFLHDSDASSGPDIDGSSPIYLTNSCIAVTVMHDFDGDVSLTIVENDLSYHLDGRLTEVWTGELEVASGEIQVTNVPAEIFFRGQFSKRVKLSVYTDGEIEAESVVIVLSSLWTELSRA